MFISLRTGFQSSNNFELWNKSLNIRELTPFTPKSYQALRTEAVILQKNQFQINISSYPYAKSKISLLGWIWLKNETFPDRIFYRLNLLSKSKRLSLKIFLQMPHHIKNTKQRLQSSKRDIAKRDTLTICERLTVSIDPSAPAVLNPICANCTDLFR